MIKEEKQSGSGHSCLVVTDDGIVTETRLINKFRKSAVFSLLNQFQYILMTDQVLEDSRSIDDIIQKMRIDETPTRDSSSVPEDEDREILVKEWKLKE